MLLSHYFAALTDQIEKVKACMASAPEAEKVKLYNTVLQLRQISDQIVEDWLEFEEKLVEAQRMFEQEESGHATLPSVSPHKAESKGEKKPEDQDVEEILLPYALAAKFRQGQGYFTLSMYREAVESFSRVLEEAPDVAVARLYLAFGFFMSRRLDVAYRKFRLLTETCDNAFICAASYNALGSIAVLEGHPEQGVSWFERALRTFPGLTDAGYNRALTLYHLRRYEEAAQAALSLLNNESDDVEVLLLASTCHAANGRENEAYALLKRAESFAYRAKQRKAIACTYERLGRFADAARCYQTLLPDYRNDASVWHGLGWSLWQAEQGDRVIPYLKYALTLAPEQPDYACSYAWVLLSQGETERAARVFEHTAQRHDHALSRAGLAYAYLKQHRIAEAQGLVNELLAAKDGHIQALGHYLQGRVLLDQGKREEALTHFSASHAAGVIRESGLYAGLVHYIDGAPEEAYKRWKEFMPAL